MKDHSIWCQSQTTEIIRSETRCCNLFQLGGGENYLHARIHWRFRHAHHETAGQLSIVGSRGRTCVGGGGRGGGKRELFTCLFPLKVQACPPWDHRPDLQSKVSGQGFPISSKGPFMCIILQTGVFVSQPLLHQLGTQWMLYHWATPCF